MLSPNDFAPKGGAPSIWSFDSGYSTTSVLEEDGGLSQPGQPHEGPWSNNNFLLPNTSREREPCFECQLWRITNPEEDIQCQACRLPETIEPLSVLLGGTSKDKGLLPPLDIPAHTQTVRVAALGNLAQGPPGPYSPDAGAAARCSACELSALIDPSSRRSCQSCTFDSSHLSPVSQKSPKSSVRRSRAGRNSKLPLSALNRLQAWLDANQHDPYPNAETKRLLAQECGITQKQVTTWFTNARARQLSPLDTYLSSSGSEDESPREEDVAKAAASPAYNTGGFTYITDDNRQQAQDTRAASVSEPNIFSSNQSHPPRASRRGKKKDYRRNATSPITTQTPILLSPTPITSPVDANPEMWQCTFCRKSMVPKSWRRHEETQHRPKAQWTCMLYGPRISFPARSNTSSVCAFCMEKNPTEAHFLSQHRIEECAKRDVGDRTYFRPDHLRQHVKNFHNASLFDIVQARWKKAATAAAEGWTCGFCRERLETWDKRETHIANHFKDGMTMASWVDYSEHPPKADKKGKAKEREGEGLHGLGRLGHHPFYRRSDRSSQSQNQRFESQAESSFSNTWDQIPSTLSLGTTQSQPPVLPSLPTLDPLTIDCGNLVDCVDWNFSAPPDPGMQYTMTGTSMFDLPATSLPQQFDSTLNMDLYSNPLDYQQSPWDQLQGPLPHPFQHQNQQHQTQHGNPQQQRHHHHHHHHQHQQQ